MAQVVQHLLRSAKPWVQSLVPQKNKKNKRKTMQTKNQNHLSHRITKKSKYTGIQL
jgi:hypothetical protein